MRQMKIAPTITSRESSSTEKYLQEISKVDLLSPEEEIYLAGQIKEGNTDALERLTKANLRFVVSVAKQYQNQGLSLPDLINEGNIGLIRATERYDVTKGFKFITYAVWWIRQSILQAIAENARIVRLPTTKLGSIGRINKAFAQLEQEFEREPTIEELSEILDLTPEEISNHIRISGKHVSVDAPIANCEDGSLLDILIDPNSPQADQALNSNKSLRDELILAMSKLTTRQVEVLYLYYGISNEKPLSLEEIGQKFDLTRERVRQIRDKALCMLKKRSLNTGLVEYLN
jgi:RNA polymerase primary sigma factor